MWTDRQILVQFNKFSKATLYLCTFALSWWKEHLFGLVTQIRSWPIMSKRNIYLADNFLIPKWWFKIEITELCDITMVSTILLIFSIVSSMATLIGNPEYSVSLMLLGPQQNSVNQFFTIEMNSFIRLILLLNAVFWQKKLLDEHTVYNIKIFHFCQNARGYLLQVVVK